MSIKPPSDIVLDVALAADPAKVAAASQRLTAGAAGASFTAAMSTASTLAGIGSPTATLAALSEKRMGQTMPQTGTAAGAMPKALRDLETFFLRTAFDGMLPATPHVSGPAGAGAGVWKSMLAEALANQVSASGGLHLLGSAQNAVTPPGTVPSMKKVVT